MPKNLEAEIQTILGNYPELVDFDKYNIALGLSGETRRTQLKAVRQFLLGARELGLKGVPSEIADVQKALAKARSINGRPYDPSTYRNIVMYTRKFNKFMGRKDVYEAVQIPRITQDRLPKILSEQEVYALIKGAENLRDRAITEVLWETACRVGELVNIRIKDLTFDEHGARIILRGKTGERVGRVVMGKADLLLLINNHPMKSDGNAHVFLGFAGKLGRNHPLETVGVQSIIHKLGEKVLRRDDVHPHMIRHSRATQLSKFLTDRELKILGGWKTDTMLARYSHLSERDVERKLLLSYGIKLDVEEIPKPTLVVRRCDCGYENPPTAIYCQECGSSLISIEEQSRIKELEERLSKLEAIYTERLGISSHRHGRRA